MVRIIPKVIKCISHLETIVMYVTLHSAVTGVYVGSVKRAINGVAVVNGGGREDI